MADDLATWPGAERRNPPRTSPTWVVRHALAALSNPMPGSLISNLHVVAVV
jgi:hypothetical protein